MKTRITLAALAAALFIIATPLHAAPPSVDALKATKIATDYLAKIGSGAPHIVSVTLELSSLVKGQQNWIIRWSAPRDINGDKEVGVRVGLDGRLVRLVEGKGGGRKKQGFLPGFYQ